MASCASGGRGNPIQRAIGGKRKFEFRRHHANNSERFEVELNLFADDCGVCSETRLPQRVAEDDVGFAFGGGTHVRSGKCVGAKFGSDAQNRDEIGAKYSAMNLIGMPVLVIVASAS